VMKTMWNTINSASYEINMSAEASASNTGGPHSGVTSISAR